jgi:hypothetical protein
MFVRLDLQLEVLEYHSYWNVDTTRIRTVAAVVDEATAALTIEAIEAQLARWLVCSDEQRLVIALWIVHAHIAQWCDQTPYLTVTSPERGCGKSRLLEILERLTPRAWYAVEPSEAVAYRNINAKFPTLLLDEVDAIFNAKVADRHEGLRAILNAGHRKTASVPRCVGTSLEIVEFRVFCPKVLAGIGDLPDTVADRSIPIRLQRKTRDEKVERFLLREATRDLTPLRDLIATWATERGEAIGNARPDMPEELSDRMIEGCESLVAIAELLGRADDARAALVTLLTTTRLDSRESNVLALLSDIRAIFIERDATAIGSATLVNALKMRNDKWAAWYGRALNESDLAKMLRDYGVASKKVRPTEEPSSTRMGYHRDQFFEVWSRYLPQSDVEE